jgi:hypothetical protein
VQNEFTLTFSLQTLADHLCFSVALVIVGIAGGRGQVPSLGIEGCMLS